MGFNLQKKLMKSSSLSIQDRLLEKVYAYYQTIWSDKWKENIQHDWLNNFEGVDTDLESKEKLNMLYLLSKFMYFGNKELRELLTSLYRDLFKYPIISDIRKSNADTINCTFIDNEYLKELDASRFLGVGNPSESGVHLLYYFRQQCGLSKQNFINTSDIFQTSKVDELDRVGNPRSYLKSEIKNSDIKRYIFIDDFCGSGSQATTYLKTIVENMKFENPKLEIKYLMLFSTAHGLEEVRKIKAFDSVEAVFTLDDSFKTFSENSRYFKVPIDKDIDKNFAKTTAQKYGSGLFTPSLGYGDCQLLFGLFHNTPDNSLPIFWSEHNNWQAIFKRYNKMY
jgi:hypothetical protein